MKHLMLVKVLTLVMLLCVIGCTFVEERYSGHPEQVKDDLKFAVEIIGKTLPVALQMMNKDIAPDYSVVVMDTEAGPDGRPIDKAVYPEWRVYHFNGFDAIVEVGGNRDQEILAVIRK